MKTLELEYESATAPWEYIGQADLDDLAESLKYFVPDMGRPFDMSDVNTLPASRRRAKTDPPSSSGVIPPYVRTGAKQLATCMVAMNFITIPSPDQNHSTKPTPFGELGAAVSPCAYQPTDNTDDSFESLGLVVGCDPDFVDDLPPVYQTPIVRFVKTKFYDAGRHQPLPFPDSDD